MHFVLHLLPGLLLALLPFASLVTTIRIFRSRGAGLRTAVLAAATVCALYVACTTELLGAMREVTRGAIAAVWVIYLAVSIVVAVSSSRRVKGDGFRGAPPPISVRVPLWTYGLIVGIAGLISLVGLTAILAPPNTWDAVSYHLSRVAMWANNHDVGMYPAFYSPQLYLGPWAEYAILHLYLLTGADYLSNMVEWLSMIGLVLGVSLVAKQLGASRRGQVFAAVACATIPGLVLEASGSMNTAVNAFWIVAMVSFFLEANESRSWLAYLGAGSAAGLAVMTKGTSYFFLPFLLLALWAMGTAESRRLWLRRLPVMVAIFLVLNGPLYVRNYRLTGSPLGFAIALGADPQRQTANSKYSIGIAYANTVKNLALQLGTPVGAVNSKVERAVRASLRVLHIDPDDQASTYRGGFGIPALSPHESSAASLLQCLLVGLAAVLVFTRRFGNLRLRLFTAGLALSLVFFCGVVRWQLWNARYYLPLLCLGIGMMGVVLERVRPRALLVLTSLLMLAIALPFALGNTIRPLAPWKNTSILKRPRQDLYFEEWHQTQQPAYQFAVREVLRGACRNVGLDTSLDDFDYPMMAMLRAGASEAHTTVKLRFYQTHNITSGYLRPEDTKPCAVICLRCAHVPAKWVEYKDIGGRVSAFDELAVFSADGAQANEATVKLPEPFEPQVLLKQLDRSRDDVAATIFAPPVNAARTAAEAKRVAQAGRDFPAKALDLTHRLEGIETLSLQAWHVRDSVDPMLRHGQKLDYSHANQLQFAAAQELDDDWLQRIPERFQEIDAAIDQLYGAWTLKVAVPAVSGGGACRVEGVKETSYLPKAGKAAESQPVEVTLEDCGCLKGKTGEVVVIQKAVGRYDEEAKAAVGCKVR